MQFIVNNNQKYFIDISYWMELLSHLQTQYNTNSRTYLVNVIRNKHRPNIVNKLFPTCGAPLRKMNTTDDLEISYLKTNNTINVFFEMYEVEGAWLLFQFKKKTGKKLILGWIPSFWFPLAAETTCETDVYIYIHVISMALIMFTPNTPLLHDTSLAHKTLRFLLHLMLQNIEPSILLTKNVHHDLDTSSRSRSYDFLKNGMPEYIIGN